MNTYLNEAKERELIALAHEAKDFAYAPYSKFRVGAALLAKNGKIYTGCNIENASFGATNCAERTAIFKAISEGVTEFTAIAIVSSEKILTYPCGICRQVMAEFMPESYIILEDPDKQLLRLGLDDVLPYRFKL